MELYHHKTDGGAELEIMSFEQLKRAGFNSVVFNGERYEL